jgi:EAL domain-containing protein (putative c-di-GMP-specific phosphodiesterase class I)
MPSDFIPIAEETGLIVPLGAWVVDERAASCATGTRSCGREDLGVSVNVAPLQLTGRTSSRSSRSPPPTRRVGPRAHHARAHRDGRRVADRPLAREPRGAARLGCSISLATFGMGYSSLGVLTELPLQELMIDRHFVSRSTRTRAAAGS